MESKKRVELKRDHLDQVVTMSQMFDQYLNSTRNATDSQLAAQYGYRVDDFDETLGKIVAHAARELREVAAEKMWERGSMGADARKGL